MMICREAVHHVSCEDVEQLSRRQQRALKRHLRMCPPCRDYADQIRTIRRIFKRKTKGMELTEDELRQLKDSIMECWPDNGVDD